MKLSMDEYLASLRQRRRCEKTIQAHGVWVGRFLTGRRLGLPEQHAIQIEEVDAFLTLWLPSLARRSRHTPLAALRGFLSFLHQQGIAQTDLSPLLVGVRAYRNEFLPQGLPRSEIKRVLEQIDRRRPNGARDFLIILLMAVYGLRVSEVLALSLDALDWERDKIRATRPKSKDHLDLPLLPEVGSAILDYLQRERPNSETKALFIIPKKSKSHEIRQIVKKHFRQSGLEPRGHVTSLFRHSLAMEMVSQGIPFKNIADVLGHRHLASTYVYAKSDVEGLRAAALPAVGGALCRSN